MIRHITEWKASASSPQTRRLSGDVLGARNATQKDTLLIIISQESANSSKELLAEPQAAADKGNIHASQRDPQWDSQRPTRRRNFRTGPILEKGMNNRDWIPRLHVDQT